MATLHEEKLVLTVDEARPQARISRGAFYEGVRKGEIPSVRIGRRILIPRRKFEAWLAGEEQSAA